MILTSENSSQVKNFSRYDSLFLILFARMPYKAYLCI